MTAARSPARATAIGAALTLAAAVAAAATPTLEPVPLPRLEAMDAAVAEQLRAAHGALESAATADLDPRRRAAAFGAFGKAALLYELSDSARAALANARALDPTAFEWAYFYGYGRQQAGDLDAAAEGLEAAIALDPGYRPARQRLGEVELDRGRVAAAVEIFEAILADDPSFTAARYGLGKAKLLERDYAAAADELERVVAEQPEAATAHYQLGLAYRALGRREEARERLARHGRSRVTFDDPLVVALDDLGRGKGLPLTIAVAARNGGDLDTAITAFRTALDTDPQDITTRTGLASTLLEAGFPEAALRELDEILRLDEDNVYAHFATGQILAGRGDFERALPHLERAIDLEPDVAQTLGFLGYAQSRVGRLAEAERSFTRALALETDNRELRMQRATVRQQLGRLDAALDDLRAVLAIDPAAADALQATATLHGRLGRFDRAAAAFERLLEVRPDDGGARFGRGLALLLARDYPAAIGHLSESAGRDGAPDAVRHLLARALATVPDAELRDPPRALELARDLMQREPTAEHAETLAMALAANGAFDDARQLQQQVVERAAGGGSATQRRCLERYRQGAPCLEPWLER